MNNWAIRKKKQNNQYIFKPTQSWRSRQAWDNGIIYNRTEYRKLCRLHKVKWRLCCYSTCSSFDSLCGIIALTAPYTTNAGVHRHTLGSMQEQLCVTTLLPMSTPMEVIMRKCHNLEHGPLYSCPIKSE